MRAFDWRARPGSPRVTSEGGPHQLRLFQGWRVDDPYQIAVCADVAPDAQLASYGVVVGDGTALIGLVAGARITRTGVLVAGLCHGLEKFGDHTAVRVLIDEPELATVLTEALRPDGPGRRTSRRLREMSLNGQHASRRSSGAAR